jgi:hypothetical protein
MKHIENDRKQYVFFGSVPPLIKTLLLSKLDKIGVYHYKKKQMNIGNTGMIQRYTIYNHLTIITQPLEFGWPRA